MLPVWIEIVPSSRIVRFISAFMSAPLSQNELVLSLDGLLPAQLEGDVVHDLFAILHTQPVNGGDVDRTARRFVLFQGGDQIAASVHQLAAVPQGTEFESQRSGGFL